MSKEYIRLHYSSKYGSFDWGDPSNKSYSCHIAVYDEQGKKVLSCNIHPEDDIEGTDAEDCIYYLEEAIKRTWTMSDARPEMLQFLQDNTEALEFGNDLYELEQINKQLKKLRERKQVLAQRCATTPESQVVGIS